MLKLSALRMVGSNLFHSMIADGKKVFLKKLCLILTIGIAYEAYEDVVYKDVFSGINLKDWKDFFSYEFCKTLVIFYTTYHHGDWSDSKPTSCQILSLEVPRIAPVIVKHALYLLNSSFCWKEKLKAWSCRISL